LRRFTGASESGLRLEPDMEVQVARRKDHWK